MNSNRSGRRWARTFLGIALFVSVVGNIAHTVLADSSISLWLRVPGAVIWPFFTFGGIEILVRMVWERSFTHRVARNILLIPAIPAAITSYEHLWALLRLMGETEFIAFIGPLAIDGMMIGCTMVLLFTRPALKVELIEDGAINKLAKRWQEQEADEILARWAAEDAFEDIKPTSSAPISPAPNGNGTRRVRGSVNASQLQAVSMIIEGATRDQVLNISEVSPATYGRLSKVYRTLRDNPNAVVDPATEKVRPELIDIMRDAARRESVR